MTKRNRYVRISLAAGIYILCIGVGGDVLLYFYFNGLVFDGRDIFVAVFIATTMTVLTAVGLLLIFRREHTRHRRNVKLALLQIQINPHFVYNTIDSIRWMAKIQDNPAIADMCRRLINLLRNVISRPGTNHAVLATVTLGEELHILEDYTEIMAIRNLGGFEVINEVPPELLECQVPKLCLQPLIENAIIHGILPSGRFGVIKISAEMENAESEYLLVNVWDNGIGISYESLEKIKRRHPSLRHLPRSLSQGKEHGLNNIGVMNVDERLKLLYGKDCGLFFESSKNEWTKVIMKIPRNTKDVSHSAR
jgi:two-component system sensor histidine kinase YesM